MSRIDRRSMLKIIAATAAGGAAATVARFGEVIPGAANGGGPPSPPSSLAAASTGPRLATTVGMQYKYLDGLSDFKFRFSSTAWSQTGGAGSIYQISLAADLLWTNLHLPQGVVLTEIILSVIVNDVSPASWFLVQRAPSGPGSTSLGTGNIVTQSASIQNISVPFSPITIDNTQNFYGMYYAFGTPNNPSAHAFYGARLGYLLAPGVTLFPDPRRVVDGFATPFAAGTTYGPFNATLKSAGGSTGVPLGATAAFCAVQSYTAGVLTLFPDGAIDPGIANYTSTQSGPLNLTYMMVPLSTAGKFKIHSYISGACFVDVWGYVV